MRNHNYHPLDPVERDQGEILGRANTARERRYELARALKLLDDLNQEINQPGLAPERAADLRQRRNALEAELPQLKLMARCAILLLDASTFDEHSCGHFAGRA